MSDELLSQEEIDALLNSAPDSSSSEGEGGGLDKEQEDILNEVASLVANAGSNVIGMLAGREITSSIDETFVVAQNEFPGRAGEGRFFRYAMKCDGLDDAPTAFVLDEKGALTVADLMMGGDGVELPEEANDLYLSAAQEGLSQVVGAAFTNISGLLKGQRLAQGEASAGLQEGDWLPLESLDPSTQIWAVRGTLNISEVGEMPLWFVLPLDQATDLAGRIQEAVAPKQEEPAPQQQQQPQQQKQQQQQQQPQQQAQKKQQQQPPSGGAPAGGAARQPAGGQQVDVRPAEFVPLDQGEQGEAPGNLDLILDIPVRLTVELGRTRKTIGEVLNMAPGSVIELEKMAGEPVDLLVNGKLIARGEIVVIDENFGVRLTEIVSRTERIRSAGI
ncbi:MAG: flagellar motor switch phosphatase FliY [Synergistales bacterium]|nr:flagellar motor switch phosphatase FliY [Synergistales bacterium]